MKSLKVWGGSENLGRGEFQRVLVAAHTKKDALVIVKQIARYAVGMSHFNNYWSETGNSVELAIAKERGAWYKTGPSHTGGHYKRLEVK